MNRNTALLGAALVVVGGLWLLDALDVVDVLRWNLLAPAAVIAVGAWMIVSGWRGRPDRRHPLADPELDEVAVLTDRELVAGATFEGGSVTALLADVDLDLRGTELVSSPTTLVVTAVLADVDLHVPHSWRVRTTGSALLSDVEVRRSEPPADATAPELVIQAAGLFGDITVR